MEVFINILIKLIPLYLMIALGFISSRKLQVSKDPIARLLIYVIAPVVIFYGTYTAQISLTNISLPVVFFILSSFLSLVFYKFGSYFFKDSTKNILAFTAGTGNTGYFGLPVVLGLFGEQAFSLAVLSILGFVLYENSLGFFLTAKGHHTVGESLQKVFRLPTIYAFFLGVILNLSGFDLGELGVSVIENFKGAYTLLGMMLIGMGLSTVTAKHVD